MGKYEYVKSKKYDHVYSYKTKKGIRYMYSFKYTGADGKRKEKSQSSFESEQSAYRKYLEMKLSVEEEDYSKVNVSKMTVSQWYDQWIEINKSSWAQNTIIGRTAVGNDYVKPLIGHIRLKDLNLVKYEVMFIKKLEEMEVKGGRLMSPSTINLYHTYFKICINAAVKRKLIRENVIIEASIPPAVEKRVKYISADQLEKILDDAYNNEPLSNFIFIMFMAYTGGRIGELQALKWKHVDFNSNMVTIEHTRKHNNLYSTKNKKVRRLRVSENTMKFLKQYRIWCIKLLFKQHQQLSEDSFVFISEQKGTAIAHSTIAYCLKRIEKRTGIKTTPHMFRHTHATILASENKSFSTIAKRLGNSPEVVMHYYAHVTEEMETDLVETFDNKINLSELLSEHIK